MAEKKKNVLLLIADDQRFDTIAALGNPQIKTPNLDRLVKMGSSFTEAFIPGGTSGAVCMPSRAMINTSRYLTSWENFGESIPDDQALLGEQLKDAGYNTFGIGKWHNGTRSFARSFTDGDDIFFGGMWDHWNVPVNSYDPSGKYDHLRHFTQDPFSSNRTIELPAEKINVGVHSTDLFADKVIETIEHLDTEEKPFFIYGAFLAPHDPRTMPEKFKHMYNPENIDLPPNFMPLHPFRYDIRGERDEQLVAYPRDPQVVKQQIADYYAMISHIDSRVGDILDTLEKEGRLEDTLIIFTGDNGLSLGQHGLMGKQNLYDASIRVPLIMAGPGIPKDHRVAGKALLLDIMPTILDYTGAAVPAGIVGHSLLPQINGQDDGRDTLFLQFTSKIRGVVNKDYKLIEYRTADGSHTQLFDRHKDPYEITNLAFAPEYRETLDDLRHQMRDLAAQLGDLDFSQGKLFWSREEKI
ncbi:sulfatase-like hydrolase/transferase [Lacticaseibacillus yichunensis]|uniref:Sulfatase-like hydrolase/transferase n=1 Tax=Lacticaseibacillus yichunensis TaxID=2486015 RepID=A0ABW4CMU2_9LACO|nr:sulfatase-like hydrolase/transferase [Lacticaseibacillus yichunensis]